MLKRKTQSARNGGQQQGRLAPSGVDFGPFHRYVGQPTQTKPIDDSKGPVVPDVKGFVRYVGFF